MPKSLTQEEFIGKATALWGDHYDLSKACYVSAKSKVEVGCCDHGPFLITPNNLLSGRGCPTCAKIVRGNKERELHALLFVSRCNKAHGTTYILDKTSYKGTDTLITVTCRKHGEFEIMPNNFLRGKGCQLCGNEQRGISNRLSQDEFIKSVRSANNLYESSNKTVYCGSNYKVVFNCKNHGEFTAKPVTLLAGKGCPTCKKYGYKVNCKGSLYVLLLGELVKIGITNRKVAARLSHINRGRQHKFEIVKEFNFQDGSIPLSIETTLLRELRATHIQPTEKFDGSTECFYDVNQKWLLSRIEELIKEHTNATN